MPSRVPKAISVLFVLFLITGCTTIKFAATAVSPTVVPGNWLFYNLSANSTVASTNLPFSFGGSLLLTGKTQVNGIFHIDQPCLGSGATDIPYAGVISGNQMTLNSSPVNGEVLNLQGTLSDSGASFHGDSLTLSGPCSGTVTALTGPEGPGASANPLGVRQPALNGTWNTNPLNPNPQIALHLTQSDTPDAHGNFAISGTASVQGSPCFTTGTLQSPSAVSGGVGQINILFNDGSTLSSPLLAFAIQGVTRSVLDIDNGTISGGGCNGQDLNFPLQ